MRSGYRNRFLSLLQIGRIPGAHMPGGMVGALTFYFIYRRMEGNPFVNAFVIVLAVLTRHPSGAEAANLFLPDTGAIGWMVKQNPKGNQNGCGYYTIFAFGQYPRRMMGDFYCGGTYSGWRLNNLSKEKAGDLNWKFL